MKSADIAEATTSQFLHEFNTEARAIRSRIDCAATAEEVDSTCADIDKLHERLAQAVFILPAFDVRRSGECLDELTAARQQRANDLSPRKPFRFRIQGLLVGQQRIYHSPSNHNSKIQQRIHAVGSEPKQPRVTSRENRNVSSSCATALDSSNDALTITSLLPSESPVSFDCAAVNMRDVTIVDLEGSTIYLRGVSRAARVTNVLRCTLCIGPVAGSVRIERCSHCAIYVAAQQVRIHRSNDCMFSLQTMSNPIIEESERLTFAPYAFRYPGIEQDAEQARLRQSDRWSKVHDFSWLRQESSPNWTIGDMSEIDVS